MVGLEKGVVVIVGLAGMSAFGALGTASEEAIVGKSQGQATVGSTASAGSGEGPNTHSMPMTNPVELGVGEPSELGSSSQGAGGAGTDPSVSGLPDGTPVPSWVPDGATFRSDGNGGYFAIGVDSEGRRYSITYKRRGGSNWLAFNADGTAVLDWTMVTGADDEELAARRDAGEFDFSATSNGGSAYSETSVDHTLQGERHRTYDVDGQDRHLLGEKLFWGDGDGDVIEIRFESDGSSRLKFTGDAPDHLVDRYRPWNAEGRNYLHSLGVLDERAGQEPELQPATQHELGETPHFGFVTSYEKHTTVEEKFVWNAQEGGYDRIVTATWRNGAGDVQDMKIYRNGEYVSGTRFFRMFGLDLSREAPEAGWGYVLGSFRPVHVDSSIPFVTDDSPTGNWITGLVGGVGNLVAGALGVIGSSMTGIASMTWTAAANTLAKLGTDTLENDAAYLNQLNDRAWQSTGRNFSNSKSYFERRADGIGRVVDNVTSPIRNAADSVRGWVSDNKEDIIRNVAQFSNTYAIVDAVESGNKPDGEVEAIDHGVEAYIDSLDPVALTPSHFAELQALEAE